MPQQFMYTSSGHERQPQPSAPPLKGRVAAYLSSKVGYFWSSARRRTTGRLFMTDSAIGSIGNIAGRNSYRLFEVEFGRIYIFVGEDCMATLGRRYSE